MKQLQVFDNPEFGRIRALDISGKPHFVGKDVADALGYSNPSKAIIMHVDDEDKIFQMIPQSQNGNMVTQAALINESGLYSLILSSKLPSAKKFKRWVTSEVLPSIRNHGIYATPQTIEAMLQDPDTMIKTLEALKEERQARLEAESQIKQDKPKVIFADAVTASHTSILVGELAKLLKQNGIDTGQNRLFEWLRDNGYLIKRKGSDYNMPTQYSMELGLFEVKETTITHSDGHISISKTPKVTGKGQLYFINKFCGDKEASLNA